MRKANSITVIPVKFVLKTQQTFVMFFDLYRLLVWLTKTSSYSGQESPARLCLTPGGARWIFTPYHTAGGWNLSSCAPARKTADESKESKVGMFGHSGAWIVLTFLFRVLLGLLHKGLSPSVKTSASFLFQPSYHSSLPSLFLLSTSAFSTFALSNISS